jgi:ATP-dependent protease ClpP protease subunit
MDSNIHPLIKDYYAEGDGVLNLDGPLGPYMKDGHALAREIWRLEAEGCERVHVLINSVGGSIQQGYSLFSALRHTRLITHTYINGLALSVAGHIFLAGQHRHMAPWGVLLLDRLAASPFEETDEPGNSLIADRIIKSVLKMYKGAVSLEEDQLSNLIERETWLTASDALEMGLATDMAGRLPTPRAELLLKEKAQHSPEAIEKAIATFRHIPWTPTQKAVLSTDGANSEEAHPLMGHIALLKQQVEALTMRLDRSMGIQESTQSI